MGHTYQFLSDTEPDGRTLQDDGPPANSIERQNVGLSWNENDPADQRVYRENGLRRDLGIPERTNY